MLTQPKAYSLVIVGREGEGEKEREGESSPIQTDCEIRV